MDIQTSRMVYKPGLENEAADALSRVPATVHLNQLTAPNVIDIEVIRAEVDKDEKLKIIKQKIAEAAEAENSKYSVKQGMLVYKDQMV